MQRRLSVACRQLHLIDNLYYVKYLLLLTVGSRLRQPFWLARGPRSPSKPLLIAKRDPRAFAQWVVSAPSIIQSQSPVGFNAPLSSKEPVDLTKSSAERIQGSTTMIATLPRSEQARKLLRRGFQCGGAGVDRDAVRE
jgi:hypothetical protein